MGAAGMVPYEVDAELFSFFISMAAREAGPALKYV